MSTNQSGQICCLYTQMLTVLQNSEVSGRSYAVILPIFLSRYQGPKLMKGPLCCGFAFSTHVYCVPIVVKTTVGYLAKHAYLKAQRYTTYTAAQGI